MILASDTEQWCNNNSTRQQQCSTNMEVYGNALGQWCFIMTATHNEDNKNETTTIANGDDARTTMMKWQ